MDKLQSIPHALLAADDAFPTDWWIWLLVAVAAVLAVLIAVLVVMLIRKKKEPADDLPTEIVIITTDETVAAAEPEEAPVEETPAEPAEPEQTEETEEPVETLAAEETVEEPAEEPVEAEEAFIPLVIADDGHTVFDRSHYARLSQADDALKHTYSDLKNEILAYRGVKSRLSWGQEAFNLGRKKCVKLQVRGKTINAYLALAPDTVEEKYHAVDVSGRASSAGVATLIKVRSPRSLKYAKQLIARVMAESGAERGEPAGKNYAVKYQSTQSLIRDGQIKIKSSRSKFIASKKKTD